MLEKYARDYFSVKFQPCVTMSKKELTVCVQILPLR